MGTLVVGVDGSHCGDCALEEAAGLASALDDDVVIVFGYDPGTIEAPEVVRQYGERIATRALQRAQGLGVDAELELIPQRPVEALLDAAERHDARAIVVGTYGEHPIKGALLGSTPHKLLHLADRPIVVVPAPEDA